MAWWIWLLVGIAALAGESATMALYLLYFGIAAFIVAALSFVGASALLQLLVFVALSVGLLGIIRPRTLHLLGREVPRGVLTNQGVRPNRTGVVAETVSDSAGMIRLGNSEFWTARTQQPELILPPGTRVRVVYVDGLTAYVEPIESTIPTDSGLRIASTIPQVPSTAGESADMNGATASAVKEESIP